MPPPKSNISILFEWSPNGKTRCGVVGDIACQNSNCFMWCLIYEPVGTKRNVYGAMSNKKQTWGPSQTASCIVTLRKFRWKKWGIPGWPHACFTPKMTWFDLDDLDDLGGAPVLGPPPAEEATWDGSNPTFWSSQNQGQFCPKKYGVKMIQTGTLEKWHLESSLFGGFLQCSYP